MKNKVYIGKNGSGKTKYLYNEFKQKEVGVEIEEVNGFQKIKNYKVFIPSVRVISTGRIDIMSDNPTKLHENYIELMIQYSDFKDNDLTTYYNVWEAEASKYISIFFFFVSETTLQEIEALSNGIVKLKKIYDEDKSNFNDYYLNINDGLKSIIFIFGIMYECREICSRVKAKAYIYIDEIENHSYPHLQKYAINKCNMILKEIKGEFSYSTHSPIAVVAHDIKHYKVIDVGDNMSEVSSSKLRNTTFDYLLDSLFEIPSSKSRQAECFEFMDKHLGDGLDIEDYIKFQELVDKMKVERDPMYLDQKYKSFIEGILDYYV